MAALLGDARVFGDGCRTGDGKCIVEAHWETRRPPVPAGEFRLHAGTVAAQGDRVVVRLGAVTPLSEGVGPDPVSVQRSGPAHRAVGAVVPQADGGILLAGLAPRLDGHTGTALPAAGIVACSDAGRGASRCTLYAAGQAGRTERAFDGSPSWTAFTERPLPFVDGLAGTTGPAPWWCPQGRAPCVPPTVGAMLEQWSR